VLQQRKTARLAHVVTRLQSIKRVSPVLPAVFSITVEERRSVPDLHPIYHKSVICRIVPCCYNVQFYVSQL